MASGIEPTLLFGRWKPIDLTCAVMIATFVAVRLPSQSHYHAGQIAFMAAIVLYGLALAFVDARRGDRFGIVILLVTASGLVSSLLSEAPITSIVGAVGRHTSLLTYVGALAAFEIARRLTPAGRELANRTFEISVYVSVLVAVIQLIAKPTTTALTLVDGRAGGLSGHPVHLASFCAGLIALKGWALVQSARTKDAVGVAVAALGIGLASSRVALLTSVIVVIVVVIRSSRRRWLAPAALVAGLVASWGIHAVFGASRGLTDRAGSEGIADRLELWGYGLRGARQHLLFGAGPGRFVVVGQHHFSPEWSTRFGSSFWADAHNVVIEIVTTWGVIGVILISTFGVLVMIHGTGPMRMLVLAMVGCWTLEPAIPGTLGIIAIAAGIAVGPAIASTNQPEIGRPQLAALLAVGGLLAGALLVGGARVEGAFERDDFAALGPLEIWYWRDPTVAARFASRISDDPSLIDRREYWLHKAVENEPDNAQNQARLALFELVTDDLEAARHSARAAIDLQPNFYAALIVLHNVGARTGDDELVSEARRRLCDFGDADFC